MVNNSNNTLFCTLFPLHIFQVLLLQLLLEFSNRVCPKHNYKCKTYLSNSNNNNYKTRNKVLHQQISCCHIIRIVTLSWKKNLLLSKYKVTRSIQIAPLTIILHLPEVLRNQRKEQERVLPRQLRMISQVQEEVYLIFLVKEMISILSQDKEVLISMQEWKMKT